MEINLQVIQVLGTQSGVSRTGKEWSKAQFIGETIEQYTKKVCVTIFNPNENKKLPNVGDRVVVSFDIESRSFVGRDGIEKWSTDIMAYRIQSESQSTPEQLAQQYQQTAPTQAQPQYQAPMQPAYQHAQVQPQYAAPQAPQVPSGPQSQQPAAPQDSDDLPF